MKNQEILRRQVVKVGEATIRILEGNDRVVISDGQSWPVWALKFLATAIVLGLDFRRSRGAVCRGGREEQFEGCDISGRDRTTKIVGLENSKALGAQLFLLIVFT